MKGVMGIFNCDECGGKLTYLARSCPHCGKRFKSNLLAADWKLGGKPTLFAACGVAVIWFAVIATSMIWVVSLAHPVDPRDPIPLVDLPRLDLCLRSGVSEAEKDTNRFLKT